MTEEGKVGDARDPLPRELVDGLAGRSGTCGISTASPKPPRMPAVPFELARQACYLAGEVMALTQLSASAHFAGDTEADLDWARQAQLIDPASIPGWVTRRSAISWALG